MKHILTLLAARVLLLCPALAETTLISRALRNGGFEAADGTDFASVPDWDSYFAEGNATDPVTSADPRTGSLRGMASGWSATGTRVHLAQTFSAVQWTIAEGDVFVLQFYAKAGSGFDVGVDRAQAILHVINAGGTAVSDPAQAVNPDRLMEPTGPVPDATTYYEQRFVSNPVRAGSPWIGNFLRMRILADAARTEFLQIDDVTLTAYRAADISATPVLWASYQAEGSANDATPAARHGTPGPGLAYDGGFGQGLSFVTASGGVTLPAALPASCSVALWMKTGAPGPEGNAGHWSEGAALCDASDGPGAGFGLSLRGHTLACGQGARTLHGRTVLTDSRWHHIAMTRDALTGRLDLYVNGQLEDTRASSSPGTASPVPPVLGAATDGSRRFAGLLDDVRLYSGLLTAADVTALYQPVPGVDSDADGFSDESETVAGTDRGSPQSRPELLTVDKTAAGLSVTMEGQSARHYQLQRLAAPGSPPSAVPAETSSLYQGAPVSLTDTTPPDGRSFYRVHVSPGPLVRPNILLVVGDDHGYADLSAYAHARPDISTPQLDRIATAGVRFTQAYCTGPVCSPARAGLLTGRHQNEWDATGGWTPGLPAQAITIAERLKAAGYATAMIGKSDVGTQFFVNTGRGYPPNHGFDSFFGFSAHAHDFWLHSQAITDTTSPAWPGEASAHLGKYLSSTAPGGYETLPDGTWQTKEFTDRAIAYVNARAAQTQPFFLYLSHASVHALIHQVPKSYLDAEGLPELPVYDPATDTFENPASYNTYYYRYSRPAPTGIISDADMRKYYRAHLRAYDDQMGRLLDALVTNNQWQNTIIVYLSDNGGEALTGANNRPLSGSKYTTFEGGLRVPMMVSWPGRVPAAQTFTHVTSSMDIVPTLLEAAGVESTGLLRGRSLLKPLATNTPVVAGPRTLCWRFNNFWAIRHGDWKLVFSDKGTASLHTTQIVFNEAALSKIALFDLAADPGETTDLADSTDPAIQAIKTDLQTRFNAWNAANTP
jgi:arylsulfatase A-like enzyme